MPNDTHARCLEQEERNYFDKNSCQYSDEILKKIDQTGLFTDISFAENNRHVFEAPWLIRFSISIASGVQRSCFSYPASLRHARKKLVLWESFQSDDPPHAGQSSSSVSRSAVRRMGLLLQLGTLQQILQCFRDLERIKSVRIGTLYLRLRLVRKDPNFRGVARNVLRLCLPMFWVR